MIDNTNNSIGEKNPYRYRSYYYDTETIWYYLNSRYYNPNIGRFITMDEVEYLGATSSTVAIDYTVGSMFEFPKRNANNAIAMGYCGMTGTILKSQYNCYMF